VSSTLASEESLAASTSFVFTGPDDAEAARQFASEETPSALFEETRRALVPALTGPVHLTRQPPPPGAHRQQLIRFYRRNRAHAVIAVILVVLAIPTTTHLSPDRTRSESTTTAASPARPIQVQSTTIQVEGPSRPALSKALPMPAAGEPDQPSLQGPPASPAKIAEATPPRQPAAVLPANDGAASRPDVRVAATRPDLAVPAVPIVPAPMPAAIAGGIERIDPPVATVPAETIARSTANAALERPLERPATPPSSTVPAGTSGPAVPDERESIRSILSKYELAYSDLNVDAAAQVYPTLDKKALGRAFASLDSQQIRLSECDIQMGGPTARAVCMGTVLWSPKVGGGVREQPRQWQFDLQRRDEGWRIGRVRVR
jgi:hypothetical protein